MKTKVMLSACALAACFVGCTNDDFLAEQEQGNITTESGEVIGADLVSHGMKINFAGKDADTRATDGAWQVGDQFGLAWYRVSGSNITAVQNQNDWETSPIKVSDNNIYANHIFTWDGNNFATTTDVYQGAYFVYWPYEKLGGVKAKTIDVNGAPQTGDFDYERYNKALHLSAQDFISAGEGLDENNQLEKEFFISPMVNVLRVTATPDARVANNDYLKGVNITQVNVNTDNEAKTFVNSGTLVPRFIPKVERTLTGGIDYEETRIEMDKAAVAATSGRSSILTSLLEGTNSLQTIVENRDYTMAEARDVRAFAFPIQKEVTYGDNENPNIYVYIGRLNDANEEAYKLGCFGIYADQTNNSETIAKLKGALDGSDAARDLRTLLRNEKDENKWAALSLPVNMNLANLDVYTQDIRSVEQWNDLVNLFDALYTVLGEKDAEALLGKPTDSKKVWTLQAPVTFKDEIKVPANTAITVKSTDKGKMLIEGTVDWPAEELLTDGNVEITVNKDATLSFQPEKATTLDANITNLGTINAGEWASISKADATTNTLHNNAGRVIVEYGAYVYPADGEEGVIAYEVENSTSETIGRINQLITPSSDIQSGQKAYAQVNTLIVRTDLDLNASASSADPGDRYEDGSSATKLKPLSNIDIELEGGTVYSNVYSEGLASGNTEVKNVISVSGNNTITDIKPQGNVTIKEGSTLNITSKPNKDEEKKDLELTKNAVIDDEGQLNVSTNVTTGDIDNETGNTKVDKGYVILYTGTYTQGGRAEGYILKQTMNDEAKAAETAWNTFVKAYQKSDNMTYEAVVTQLQNYGDDSGDTGNFFRALNEWRSSIGLSQISAKANITVDDLKLFEMTTQISLGLTDAQS